MFRGLAAISLRFLSRDIRCESLVAKSVLSLKYLVTNPFTCSSVNPSIWSSTSQHFLTSFPASCLAVATMWHLGSTLPSINSENIDNLLDGNSSNPSNINKMLDWFSRIKWKNCCLTSSSMSRGRSWSSIASQTSEWISRHFSNNTTLNAVEPQPWGSCCFVAQS